MFLFWTSDLSNLTDSRRTSRTVIWVGRMLHIQMLPAPFAALLAGCSVFAHSPICKHSPHVDWLLSPHHNPWADKCFLPSLLFSFWEFLFVPHSEYSQLADDDSASLYPTTLDRLLFASSLKISEESFSWSYYSRRLLGVSPSTPHLPPHSKTGSQIHQWDLANGSWKHQMPQVLSDPWIVIVQ